MWKNYIKPAITSAAKMLTSFVVAAYAAITNLFSSARAIGAALIVAISAMLFGTAPASATAACVSNWGGTAKARECCAKSYSRNAEGTMDRTARRLDIQACMSR